MTPSRPTCQGRVRLTAEVAAACPEMARELVDGVFDRQENGSAHVIWNRGAVIGWIRATDIEPIT